MQSVKSLPGKMKGYGIVRDKNGNPKIDNPEKLPKEILDSLSEQDRNYIYGNNTHNIIA